MANLIIQENGVARTTPAINGEEITITAPCDCSSVTGVSINGTVYPFYDAMGNSIETATDLFANGNLIRVMIDTNLVRAQIINIGSSASKTKAIHQSIKINTSSWNAVTGDSDLFKSTDGVSLSTGESEIIYYANYSKFLNETDYPYNTFKITIDGTSYTAVSSAVAGNYRNIFFISTTYASALILRIYKDQITLINNTSTSRLVTEIANTVNGASYKYVYSNAAIKTNQIIAVTMTDADRLIAREAALFEFADLTAGKLTFYSGAVPSQALHVVIDAIETSITYDKASVHGAEQISENELSDDLQAKILEIDNKANTTVIQQLVLAMQKKANLVDGKVPTSELPALPTILLPQLTVTAETGATVTATCSGNTLTETSTGTCSFDLPSYGTWTVTATKGSDSASKTIEIDSVKQYNLSVPFIPATFSGATWSQIKDVASAVSDRFFDGNPIWNIGDTKPITLSTGQVVNARIIDFCHDEDADGNIIPITFDIDACLNTTYQINSSSSNYGGWESSQLRTTLNGTIFNYLPSDLREAITPTKKKSSGGYSSSLKETTDKLFLLSEVELLGSATNSTAGEGTLYPYFSSNARRIKKVNGSDSTWWTRSSYSGNGQSFCHILANGTCYANGAGNFDGVSFGFCIG